MSQCVTTLGAVKCPARVTNPAAPSGDPMSGTAPLLHLRLFRLGRVAGSNAVGFLLGTSFLTFVFLGTLYMQQVLGFAAGLVNTSQNFVYQASGVVNSITAVFSPSVR